MSMTNVDIDAFSFSGITEVDSMPVSTPMQRAASQLQRVLPPGWRVEVAEVPPPSDRLGQPVLRLVPSQLR
ncbi:hypothetical protein [Nocardia jejuensis]|uniref:hypothetical protein n=1 Tax=Nocardia jejuensis TaxID=328049 RepID=UPI0008354825|nr:hypothetical protein [Nocardia jejuensis]